MPNLTPARLAALREAEKRAIPSPWHIDESYGDIIAESADGKWTEVGETEDAPFVCEMRNALPDLLTTIDRLRALLREAREYIAGGESCIVDADSYPKCAAMVAKLDAELGEGEG